MDSSKDYEVYLGFWTNWSHGKIKGATVTLTRDNGSLLIAFLAIFVGVVGRCFWRVLCFALHSLLSQPVSPQDGFYHQRQAILRNSETALQGSWQILCSIIAWRRSSNMRHIIRRGMPIAGVAITLSCGFALAGIFASRISNSNANEVLLSGSQCGRIHLSTDNITGETRKALHTSLSPRWGEALSYAELCYRNSSSNKCNTYVKQRLPLIIDRNASCPFDTDICQTQFGNVKLDTGYMDTHTHLGMNAPPRDRFSLRLTTHCAPLKTDGFSETVEVVNQRSNQSMKAFQLYYGPYRGQSVFGNYTYRFPINQTRLWFGFGSSMTGPSSDYDLGVAAYYESKESNTSWVPIPQLQRPRADISIYFLSAQDVAFQAPVDDPWYATHILSGKTLSVVSGQSTGNVYAKDEPASAMACATQEQYCTSDASKAGKRCTELHGSWAQDLKLTNGFNQEERRKMAAMNTYFDQIRSPLGYVAQRVGPQALLSRSTLSQSIQGPLPNNQWQKEVENFGRTIRYSPSFERKPAKNETDYRSLCDNQKIINPQYPSFNVLGLCLILTIGSLIILVDWCLPSIIQWIGHSHKKTQKTLSDEESSTPCDSLSDNNSDITAVEQTPNIRAMKQAEWNITSTLQLQRLAHEGIGSGTWHRTSSDTPVTLANEPLAVLGFKKPPGSHPYLVNTNADPTAQVDHSEITTDSTAVSSPTPNQVSNPAPALPSDPASASPINPPSPFNQTS